MAKFVIELTNRCNLSCLHCFRATSKKLEDLSPDLIEKVLKEADFFGKMQVCFTGGEPTLHPEFEKIVVGLVKYRKKISVFGMITNGINFKNVLPVLLWFKKRFPPIRIIFSVEGTRAVHDRIRGKNTYDKTLEAMTMCREWKIGFGIQMALHRLSEPEIENLMALALDLKAKFYKVYPALPTPVLLKENLVLSFKEAEEALLRYNRLVERFIEKQSESSAGTLRRYLAEYCPWLDHMMPFNLNHKGEITFCCNLSNFTDEAEDRPDVLGSLREASVMTLYERYINLFSKFSKDKLKNIQSKKVILSGDKTCLLGCLYCTRYFKKFNHAGIYEDYGIFI